jgi:hypothetical protein
MFRLIFGIFVVSLDAKAYRFRLTVEKSAYHLTGSYTGSRLQVLRFSRSHTPTAQLIEKVKEVLGQKHSATGNQTTTALAN